MSFVRSMENEKKCISKGTGKDEERKREQKENLGLAENLIIP